MFKRIIAVLVTALLATVFGVAIATTASAARPARPAVSSPTFILDTSGFRSGWDSPTLGPEVAKVWSKNTGVTVTTGICDLWDPRCIKAVSVDGAVCNGTVAAVGCATDSPTGGCYVELSDAYLGGAAASYTFDFNALAHEVGHCIIHRLGGGYWHASNPSDIMYGSVSYYDPKKRITHETRSYLGSLL